MYFQRIKEGEFHLNKDIKTLKLLPDPFVRIYNNIRKSDIVKFQILVNNTK